MSNKRQTPPTPSTLERLLDDHYGNQVGEKLMDWLLEKEEEEERSLNQSYLISGSRQNKFSQSVKVVREALGALGYDRREQETEFERTMRQAPTSGEIVSFIKRSRFNPKD
jgi:Holliday junction resolvasome RuvABC DNA-binding subunit